MVEVYADLLFLINAGMDGLCFCLTGKLLHRRLTAWRWLTGTVLGGVYAVAALLLDVGQAASLLIDIGVCVLMCAVVFGGRASGGWHRLPAATAVYFVLSMVLGGVMTALYNLLNQAGFAAWLPEGEDGLGTWLFALLAAAGGAITLWGGRIFRRSASVRTCRVTVELDGRSAELLGMVDTGNLLRDPVGGRPVICADADALAGVLSPSLLAVMRSGHPDASILSGTAEARRLRVIPTGTATGTGMLLGFLPDRVTVTVETGRAPMPQEVEAVVAVMTEGLGDGIGALVPSELVG